MSARQRGDGARDPGARADRVPGQEEPVEARGRAGEGARQPRGAGCAAGARRHVLPAGARRLALPLCMQPQHWMPLVLHLIAHLHNGVAGTQAAAGRNACRHAAEIKPPHPKCWSSDTAAARAVAARALQLRT